MTTTTTTAALEPISLPEPRDLIALESVIERGLDTFVQVGEALAEIRDRKLYRTEHPTFDAYLNKKWSLSRSHACRLIQAAETVKVLPTGNRPQTERQARPLAALPPAQRAEVWNAAVAAAPNGQPTTALVEWSARLAAQASHDASEAKEREALKPPRIKRGGWLRATFSVTGSGEVEIIKVERRESTTAIIIEADMEAGFILAQRMRAIVKKAGVILTRAKEFEKADPQPFREIMEGTASEPDATKTPLQWLTHYWMEASEGDRCMFDNFRAGLRGGT